MPIAKFCLKSSNHNGLTRAVACNRNGFSVVEMLVATAVFAVVVTAIIQLLLMFLKGPLRQMKQKQLEEQLTYATTEMSHYIREAKIDYSTITGTGPFQSLAVITHDQTHVSFSYDSSAKTIVFNQGGVTANLTGSKVVIQSVEFYLYPETDPTTVTVGASAVNNQPAVVMIIKAQHFDDASITSQAQVLTISRYYAR